MKVSFCVFVVVVVVVAVVFPVGVCVEGFTLGYRKINMNY